MTSVTTTQDNNQVTAELGSILRIAKEQDRLIAESKAILADIEEDLNEGSR